MAQADANYSKKSLGFLGRILHPFKTNPQQCAIVQFAFLRPLIPTHTYFPHSLRTNASSLHPLLNGQCIICIFLPMLNLCTSSHSFPHSFRLLEALTSKSFSDSLPWLLLSLTSQRVFLNSLVVSRRYTSPNESLMALSSLPSVLVPTRSILSNMVAHTWFLYQPHAFHSHHFLYYIMLSCLLSNIIILVHKSD